MWATTWIFTKTFNEYIIFLINLDVYGFHFSLNTIFHLNLFAPNFTFLNVICKWLYCFLSAFTSLDSGRKKGRDRSRVQAILIRLPKLVQCPHLKPSNGLLKLYSTINFHFESLHISLFIIVCWQSAGMKLSAYKSSGSEFGHLMSAELRYFDKWMTLVNQLKDVKRKNNFFLFQFFFTK